MSNIDEVIIFKDMLKNYKRYIIRKEYLDNLLLEAEYNQQGVKGIDTSKEPTTNGLERSLVILNYIDKIDFIKYRIKVIQEQLTYIESVLNIMDDEDRQMIIDIYVNNVPYYEMAIRKNYSESGLKKKVNSLIKSALSTLY